MGPQYRFSFLFWILIWCHTCITSNSLLRISGRCFLNLHLMEKLYSYAAVSILIPSLGTRGLRIGLIFKDLILCKYKALSFISPLAALTFVIARSPRNVLRVSLSLQFHFYHPQEGQMTSFSFFVASNLCFRDCVPICVGRGLWWSPAVSIYEC